jgi:hypothetical protein
VTLGVCDTEGDWVILGVPLPVPLGVCVTLGVCDDDGELLGLGVDVPEGLWVIEGDCV